MTAANPQPHATVPPGYKQTEVGVIPDDWVLCSVGEKGSVVVGKALAANAPGAQRPYLRTKNVFDGRVIVDDVLTMPMTDEQFAHFRIFVGDVLLNEGQSLELVGRCAIYREEYPEQCAIQNQLIRFRANSSTSGAFASHAFRHCQRSGVFAGIALQTTSIAHLGGSRFERLILAWPPTLAEQEAIAGALSDADAWIESLEKLIAKKRAIKQGTMQALLTPPGQPGHRRLPGFDGEWEVKRLGEIEKRGDIRLFRGMVISQKDIDQNPGSNPIYSSSVHMEGIFGRYGSYMLDEELITWSIDGGGHFFYRPKHKFSVTNVCGYIRVLSKRIVCRFLACALQELHHHQVFDYTMKAHPSVIRNQYVVPLPPQDEQSAIAFVLTDMDAEIEALEAKLAKARQIKQGMMQELLTGRIRLVQPKGGH